MNGLDHVEYTFNPKDKKSLKPGAELYIGKRIRGQVLWIIEEGMFKGQWAIGFGYSSSNFKSVPAPHFFWCPEEDCDDIKILPLDMDWTI